MNTPSESISLESILRQLPSALREAPPEQRLAYIRRKKGQFKLLFWMGLGMGALIVALTAVTFFLPDIEPMDNLVLSIVIIAAFAGASFGNRKMAQRFEAFEARMRQEVKA